MDRVMRVWNGQSRESLEWTGSYESGMDRVMRVWNEQGLVSLEWAVSCFGIETFHIEEKVRS